MTNCLQFFHKIIRNCLSYIPYMYSVLEQCGYGMPYYISFSGCYIQYIFILLNYTVFSGVGSKGGTTNLKVGGHCIERGRGGNTVKTLTFEKGGGCMTPSS